MPCHRPSRRRGTRQLQDGCRARRRWPRAGGPRLAAAAWRLGCGWGRPRHAAAGCCTVPLSHGGRGEGRDGECAVVRASLSLCSRREACDVGLSQPLMYCEGGGGTGRCLSHGGNGGDSHGSGTKERGTTPFFSLTAHAPRRPPPGGGRQHNTNTHTPHVYTTALAGRGRTIQRFPPCVCAPPLAPCQSAARWTRRFQPRSNQRRTRGRSGS